MPTPNDNVTSLLSTLLGAAWLLPLVSFALIVFFGKRMGKGGKLAGYVACGAIMTSCVLSLIALFGVWLPNHPLPKAEPAQHAVAAHDAGHAGEHGSHEAHPASHAHGPAPPP